MSRITWFAVAALGLLSLGFAATQGGAGRDSAKAERVTRVQPLAGGPFEASGVAAVRGADGVLFIDDSQGGAVMWLEINADGGLKRAPVPVPLGVDVVDPEGLTTDGDRFLIVSSLSRASRARSVDLVRFRFDPVAVRADGVEAVRGLQRWLADRVPELRSFGGSNDEAGLNIEGLAWDSSHDRLLLGLRSPLVDGQALVIPLKIRDSQEALTLERLSVDGASIRLPIDNAGIRSIEAGARGGFQLIAAPEGSGDFRLVEWSGNPQDGVREVSRFAARLKPEGVTSAVLHGTTRTVVMFDANGFLVLK